MNIYIDILLIKNIYNGHMVGAGADPKDVVIPGLKDEVHARNRRRHCAGKLSVILLTYSDSSSLFALFSTPSILAAKEVLSYR